MLELELFLQAIRNSACLRTGSCFHAVPLAQRPRRVSTEYTLARYRNREHVRVPRNENQIQRMYTLDPIRPSASLVSSLSPIGLPSNTQLLDANCARTDCLCWSPSLIPLWSSTYVHMRHIHRLSMSNRAATGGPHKHRDNIFGPGGLDLTCNRHHWRMAPVDSYVTHPPYPSLFRILVALDSGAAFACLKLGGDL